MSFMGRFPGDYFRSPIEGSILLSGTFMELRPNHFHAGIDVKGKTGTPLYAAAEGYIARIKVEPGGYGQALYIRHPNGYTTVYAHMDAFAPKLARWVRDQQYARRSFAVDLRPEAGRFPVRKGERIGDIGNKGGSLGAHLHFEVRRSDTQRPVNPLLFGFEVDDRMAPEPRMLKVYSLDQDRATLHQARYNVYKTPNGYRLPDDTLLVPGWRMGLGIKVHDQMNGAPNYNGIYALDALVNGQPVYQFAMESFSFSETRYLNAHLDYAEQVARRNYVHRCYRLPGNALSIYVDEEQDGVVPLYENKAQQVMLVMRDATGNTSTLSFWVKRDPEALLTRPEAYSYALARDEAAQISTSGLRLQFPSGSFYEDVKLQFGLEKDTTFVAYSPRYQVDAFTTPVHRYFSVGIEPTGLPADLRDKACIAYWDGQQGSRIYSLGGRWQGDELRAESRYLGQFFISADEEPPRIQPVRFQSDMRGKATMEFEITDNMPTAGRARALRYSAWLNETQWLLFEYDAKNDRLIHDFEDGVVPAGQHALTVVVRDDRGNERVWRGNFLR